MAEHTHNHHFTAIAGALLLALSACKGTPEQPPPSTTTNKAKPEPPKPEPPKPEPSTPDVEACKDPINPCVVCNTTEPNTAITSALLTRNLPCTVTATPPFDLTNLQRSFDYHSWLLFLAINAPADGGLIGSGAGPGGDASTVWESYRNIADVMLPGGAAPPPWGTPTPLPPECEQLGVDNHHVLRMVGKTPDLLNEFDQPFNTGPLIDQAGRYTRYEILINQPMFESIVANKLYSKAGQAAFTDAIVFPEGQLLPAPDKAANASTTEAPGQLGAIMIKAAWKQLDEGEPLTNFHTTEALIYTPPSDQPKIAASCRLATVGLVGLHIAQKTEAEPQWVWSTYEHVANAPTEGAIDPSKTYNYYDPKCSTEQCPVNTPPPRPWDPNVEPFPNGFHSQIVRVTPITDEVAQLNAAFQALVPNSVWANYQLVSTQWPTDAQSATDPNGVPAPVFLANTTMETYVQGSTPQSSSSCMACHGNAAATTGRESDFTYILERAQ